MANGAFKFKDNSGNVVSFISGSGSNISFSGGTLDLSGMTGLTLGNLTLSGTTQNAISTSHAASYLLTSSFNTYSGTTNTFIGTTNTIIETLQTSTGSLNSFTSSTNTRLNSIEGLSGTYATTGSNTFIGTQTITGSLFISSNLVVQGSSSLENITASAVNIGANIVNLNTANPAIRFAGLNIFDSGSIGGSGSFLYDAVQDEFIFIHRGDNVNITSSVALMGPQTYNNVGSEIYPTNNRLLKGTGNEHVGDSIVSETGGGIGISGSLSVTGSVLIGVDTGVRFDTSGASGHPELSVDSSAALNFKNTAGLNSLTIANSRNVGVGVTPSTWNSNSRALQLPQFVSLSNQNNGSLNLMSFALETSSDAFTYGDTGVFPLRYNQNPNNGVHSWHVAGTGTAGNAITFTQTMTLDSSGRLGIGTSSPDSNSRLDVNGQAFVAHLAIYNNNGTPSIGTSPMLYSPASGTLAISTNASERMRITSSGNILINQSSVITGVSTSVEMSGIGSSSATQQASYNVYANHGSSNPTWRGYYVMHKSRGTTAGSFTSVASGDHLGTVRWVGADGTGYVIGAEINGMVDGNPGTNDMPTRLEFSTTADGASGPTEHMRLQSNGVLKIGNGGIADDGLNPGYKNVAISFNNAQNRGEIQAVQQQVLVYPLILNGAGGSVGIGTYSPATSTKLMVAGGIGFGNTTDGTANLSYGGRISAKQTSVSGGGGATLIHRGLGSVGYFILVSGIHSGNRFTDLIYGTGSNTPIVLASNTENTAPTRTYSISGENIFVSLTNNAAVWIVVTTGLGAMES